MSGSSVVRAIADGWFAKRGSRASSGRQRRPEDFWTEGDGCRDQGDWLGAVDAYGDGLALDETAFAYWVQYGHALKEVGRFDDALAAYRTAGALRRGNPDLLVVHGHLLKDTGRSDAAATSYAAALVAGSRDDHAMHFLRNRPEAAGAVRDAVRRLLGARAGDAERVACDVQPLSLATLILRESTES